MPVSLSQRLIRQHDVFTAGAADPDIFRSDLQVPSGEVWRIDRHGFRLLTDEITLARSFIESGGDLHLLNEWPAPASPFFYVDTWAFMLGPGERLALELTGIDASDVIHLIYSGVILQNPTHIPPPDLEPTAEE